MRNLTYAMIVAALAVACATSPRAAGGPSPARRPADTTSTGRDTSRTGRDTSRTGRDTAHTGHDTTGVRQLRVSIF